MAYGGLRRSELLGLDWDDVDLSRRLLKVRKAKGGRQRTIPIHPALAPLFADYYAARLPQTEQALFVGVQGGRLNYTQLGQVFRHYRTAAGRRPIKEFIDDLSDVDAAAIAAAMKDVRETGLAAARHLRDEIYEVRADGDRQTFRVLFAPEGQRGQILLALDGFSKKTQKTPPQKIQLAERRLTDWRRRGAT